MAKVFFVIAFSVLLLHVHALDDVLLTQSILYGISFLANGSSTLCQRELSALLDAVEEKQVWALKAVDSSGQPDQEFIMGNNLWIGSHTQCVDISNRKAFELNHDHIPHKEPTPFDFPPYEMRFVTALLVHNSTFQLHTQMPLDYKIRLGLCAPLSCSEKELSSLIQNYMDQRYLHIQNLYSLDINVTKLRPLTEDLMWLMEDPAMIILLVIFVVIAILSVIGTTVEVKERRRLHQNLVAGFNKTLTVGAKTVSETGLVTASNNTLNYEEEKTNFAVEILKCFSFRKNLLLILNSNVSQDSIAAVHGLRLFGMLWVIMVHAVFYIADFVKNTPYVYRLSETFFNQILSNSTYCVDTYLFLSGFLVSYAFYRSKKKSMSSGKPTNYLGKVLEYITMFINRYLRLTPTYMIIICVATVSFSFYRKTSAMYASEQLEENCAKYWWRNLLYINNLFPRKEMCLSWSWYLSLDTQCFALSTFLLMLSTVCFKTAATLLFTILFACIAATAYKVYNIGYIPTMDEQYAKLDDIYDLPWNRMGPYLIGVIAGYILIMKLDGKLILKTRTLVFLWTVFPLLNLWILFGIYTRQMSIEFSAFYMGTSRTLWGVGLAWLMIACCTNNAGLINKFLSYSGWIPYSRLTYCCYLLNPLVAYGFYLGSENQFVVTQQTFTLVVVAVAFGSFFYSLWASLFFETPFILMTKLLLAKVTTRKKTPATSSENPA